MQCGAACLSMICEYYGVIVPVSFFENECAPTSEGVSMLSISECAEMVGFETECVKIDHKTFSICPLPCILHWNQNHFVVLYKIDRGGDRFWIADPAKGKYRLTVDEFNKCWLPRDGKGVALLLSPTCNFMTDNHKDEIETHSLRFIYGYISQYKKHLISILLGLLLGCIFQLILPFLTQWIVDLAIKHNDIHLIWMILMGEMMIVIGRTTTDFIRRWLLLHISMRVNISLVSDFFIKLLKLPMSFFDTKMMGDLLQRISDHGRVQSFLTTQMLGMVFTMLSFVVFGIVLFIYDKVIFITFLSGSILYGIWIARFLGRRKVLDYELFEQEAINRNRTYQFITTMQEIKLQGCERRRRWEWEDTQADLFNVQMKSLRLQQIQEAGGIFINEIKNIFITVFAATAVIEGQITLGAMLAIQYIVGQLNSPIEQLMQFVYALQDVRISLERINEIHGATNEETIEHYKQGFFGKKSIELKDLSFKYDKHALRYTLEDISFSIQSGKVTAIVGPSGSGKTTLIKLMLGYYPIHVGEIKISGVNIEKYNLKWWRQHCGVVMQNGTIFSESIARNIAVDDSEIDAEKLKNAAKIACIHDFVLSLPHGYDTKIGRDGVGLSQGQKQRILIARAVYKNPDFIFLDEATNALDANNERLIVENLDKFYKGRTVVIVAHRLSTVKNADQIIVVDGGRVVESGTHTELIEKNGIYFNLIRNQLELGE